MKAQAQQTKQQSQENCYPQSLESSATLPINFNLLPLRIVKALQKEKKGQIVQVVWTVSHYLPKLKNTAQTTCLVSLQLGSHLEKVCMGSRILSLNQENIVWKVAVKRLPANQGSTLLMGKARRLNQVAIRL